MSSVHTRTLQKAAELLGGERALARYLRVPMPELFAWMGEGATPPPGAVFLRAVDLVLNDLDVSDQARAQALRIASAHSRWVE